MNEQTLNLLFTVVIIPLLGALTTFAVKFLNAKANEIKGKTNNERAQYYMDMVLSTVTDCVIATNQTYVESLKKAGSFDTEAQKEAFQKTLDAVLAILTDDAKEYLVAATGDINVYLTSLIEAAVNSNK